MDASDGTSEAAPLLAGVLALATQLNHGQDVGPINNVLYHVLGPHGRKDGIADVVSGNNSVIRKGKVVVTGFTAAKGFDVASGWGTIRANIFAPALAAATAADHQDRAVRGTDGRGADQAGAPGLAAPAQGCRRRRYLAKGVRLPARAPGALAHRRHPDHHAARRHPGPSALPDQARRPATCGRDGMSLS